MMTKTIGTALVALMISIVALSPVEAGEPSRSRLRKPLPYMFIIPLSARAELRPPGKHSGRTVVNAYFRPSYSGLAHKVTTRLLAKDPLIMDARAFEQGKGKLPSLVDGAQEKIAVESGKIEVAVEKNTIVITYPNPAARKEILRYEGSELPAEGDAREAMRKALKSLPRFLELRHDRPETMFLKGPSYYLRVNGRDVPLTGYGEITLLVPRPATNEPSCSLLAT